METEALFQEKVYLTPKDMRGEVESIDALLQAKLQEKLEQRCSPHGFVLPGTLELLTRSAGMVDSGRFSGDWTFLVKAKARVLHPPEGTVVEVEIIKINKMGIYAVYENAIRLMVPRDLHLGDEEFDQLKVGDNIKVEIQKSRFQLRDPFIVSVGIYRGRSNGATKVLNEQAPEDAPEQAQEAPEQAQEAEEAPEGGAEEEEEEEETEE